MCARQRLWSEHSNGRTPEMQADETDLPPVGGADHEDSEMLERGPFRVESVRWTRNASAAAAVRASINLTFERFAPIYMRISSEVFEVKPSRLCPRCQVADGLHQCRNGGRFGQNFSFMKSVILPPLLYEDFSYLQGLFGVFGGRRLYLVAATANSANLATRPAGINRGGCSG